jgi:tetratricopeptide (TPR) repeat protein/O-antigen ligase
MLLAAAAGAWLAGELMQAQLTWRRTPLDLPLLLLAGFVVVQLALGNRPLVAWALAPERPPTDPVAPFPAPLLALGTVAPRQTLDSLSIFIAYAAAYVLVVQVIRTRRQLGGLVRALVFVGGLTAFLALIDYLARETWLLGWLRDAPYGGRAAGTYVNPDHFASWLAMLIPLGLGWLATRARAGHGDSVRSTLSIRGLRERAVRRSLPLLAVLVMAVAVVFTLSRGGIIAVAVGLVTFLALLRAAARMRRGLTATALVLVAVAAYGGWIGFGPLLARLSSSQIHGVDRVAQYASSLPMLREFPLFGVGLGAYRDIYPRYQPLALHPGVMWYPYAHSDLLQLVLELGVAGAFLCLFLAWRIVVDLVGAHVLGRSACPVDGGAGPEARRHDRYSVGIASGALAGAAALVAHSALDFSARIPANGLLAAALLGIATVALHTRLAPDGEQVLSAVRALDLAGRARATTAIAIVAAVILIGWMGYWVHLARVRDAADALGAASAAERAARAQALLALDHGNVAALQARAAARQVAALAAWTAAPVPGVDRRAAALALLADGRADLRAALARTPTDASLHLDLAWIEATDAVVDGRAGPDGLAASLAHAARAAAVARDSAVVYATMARLAYTAPELGLRAAREAVRRDPEQLSGMVGTYARLGLSGAEWLSMVPETAADRLDLAAELEDRGLEAESLVGYRAATEVAPASQAPLVRWALGSALARDGQARAAADELQHALTTDPGNPELERALGEALGALGDPAALDHLRLALAAMERRAQGVNPAPFDVRDPRLLAWSRAHGGADLDRVGRYRRGLARYLGERRLWDQALAEWRALVQAEPRDADARFGLGSALDATGARSEALEQYRAAVDLDPRATRFRARLAGRLWDTEQYYQAINEWRTILAQTPADVQTRMMLGRALEKIGQREDAYREYRTVLELRPDDADARRALARFR